MTLPINETLVWSSLFLLLNCRELRNDKSSYLKKVKTSFNYRLISTCDVQMQLLTLSAGLTSFLRNMRNRYIEISNIYWFDHVASYSTLLAVINTVRVSQLILTFWSDRTEQLHAVAQFATAHNATMSGMTGGGDCLKHQNLTRWYESYLILDHIRLFNPKNKVP